MVYHGKQQKNPYDGILNNMVRTIFFFKKDFWKRMLDREEKTLSTLLSSSPCFFFLNVTAGPVASVDVMKDRVTGDPRGFAFVVFKDPTTVDLVMNEPNHEINHKIVDVKRAQARGVAPPSIHHGGAGGAADSSAGGSSSNAFDKGGRGGPQHEELTPEQMHTKVFVGGTWRKSLLLYRINFCSPGPFLICSEQFNFSFCLLMCVGTYRSSNPCGS